MIAERNDRRWAKNVAKEAREGLERHAGIHALLEEMGLAFRPDGLTRIVAPDPPASADRRRQ